MAVCTIINIVRITTVLQRATKVPKSVNLLSDVEKLLYLHTGRFQASGWVLKDENKARAPQRWTINLEVARMWDRKYGKMKILQNYASWGGTKRNQTQVAELGRLVLSVAILTFSLEWKLIKTQCIRNWRSKPSQLTKFLFYGVYLLNLHISYKLYTKYLHFNGC